MAAAGAKSGWGLDLRWFREAVRHETREEFAAALNRLAVERHENAACGARLVGRWEDGDVLRPRPIYQRLLVAIGAPVPDPDAHGVASTSLTGSSSVELEVRGVEDDVRRRDFLGAVASAMVGSSASLASWVAESPRTLGQVAGDVGEVDVDHVRQMTESLRSVDQRLGGAAVVDAAAGLLTWSVGLLPLCRREAVESSLRQALADLASLTGWACHDAGRQHQARRYLAQALMYSRQADPDVMSASILYRLGRVSLHERQPDEAVKIFQLGQISAQQVGDAAESARLYANEAWACAMLGQRRRAQDALARTEDLLGEVQPDDVRPWTQVFMVPGDLTGHKALVASELAGSTDDRAMASHVADEAAELARASLASSGPDRAPRSLLFDRIVLATSEFRTGDVDSALNTTRETITFVNRSRSVRAHERLREIYEASGPFAGRSDVRDAADEMATVMGSLAPSG